MTIILYPSMRGEIMHKRQYEEILKDIKSKNIDICIRAIGFQGSEVSILYIKELTDRVSLSELVIKPLIKNKIEINLKARKVINNVIFADDCLIEHDNKKIETFLLDGMTIILFSNDNEYIVINLKKIQHRAVSTPELNYVLRGPKDCFIENLDTNISLIRYRIKDVNLRIDYQEVGERTKTRVAVIYIEDIANNIGVTEIKKRISNIKIDGIVESGELQAFLLNNKMDLFPQMGIIERSDMACSGLLEGKVITLVEGSGLGLIAPKVLSEFLSSDDDIYDNKYIALFAHGIRFLALILSLTISSIYIAIVSFHNDILPADYILVLAESRSKVPFSALVEVLIVEIVIELLREAILRVPSKIGTAIGIVGAIVIGDAAIAAGIFSPLLLIVVATSMISSLIPSDQTLVNPFRVLKFLLIGITAMFGFYGFTLGITLLLAHLISINTFGVPYMAPFAPFIFTDAVKVFFYNKSLAPRRARFLRTKDKFRSDPAKQGKP